METKPGGEEPGEEAGEEEDVDGRVDGSVEWRAVLSRRKWITATIFFCTFCHVGTPFIQITKCVGYTK